MEHTGRKDRHRSTPHPRLERPVLLRVGQRVARFRAEEAGEAIQHRLPALRVRQLAPGLLRIAADEAEQRGAFVGGVVEGGDDRAQCARRLARKAVLAPERRGVGSDDLGIPAHRCARLQGAAVGRQLRDELDALRHDWRQGEDRAPRAP